MWTRAPLVRRSRGQCHRSSSWTCRWPRFRNPYLVSVSPSWIFCPSTQRRRDSPRYISTERLAADGADLRDPYSTNPSCSPWGFRFLNLHGPIDILAAGTQGRASAGSLCPNPAGYLAVDFVAPSGFARSFPIGWANPRNVSL